MIVIEGTEIDTTPGAMLRLDCGDHVLAEGVFGIGDEFTCTEDECGAATTVAGVVPFEIMPVVTVTG